MKTLQTTLPVVVLLFFVGVTFWLVTHSPKSDRMPKPKASQLSVETTMIKPQNYVVHVSSYGSVKPRIQGELVAEVAGKITYVSDQFREGGYFQQDQVLLKIDPAQYQLEVRVAESTLNSAKQAFIEEQALAEVAKQDWERSGRRKSAGTDLALRKPQLETARANIESAQAKLDIARLNLQRTTIKAPYRGRILKKYVEIGQVISVGKKLGDLFSTDFIEIRLPINNKDLPFVDLPEKTALGPSLSNLPNVSLSSDLLMQHQSWSGKLIRTESAIDDATQQLNVIAQIDNPYSTDKSGLPQLKIGQYLTADITGKTIDNAIVIPNASIYQGSYVYLVEDGTLQRRDISILWQNDQRALIGSGLAANDELVVTPIGQVVSGTRVVVLGKESGESASSTQHAKRERGKGRDGEGMKKPVRDNEDETLVNAVPEKRVSTP